MSLPRRNLELKAADPDPPRTLAAALALEGVEDHGTLRQRDTYFRAASGRLKLREDPGAVAELIAYARADQDAPKVSRYRIVPVHHPAELTDALRDTLGIRAVVDKERRLLLWRGVRIHLDRVAELGAFVELEAVAASTGDLDGEQEKVDHLRASLGLDDALLIAEGYADLLGA